MSEQPGFDYIPLLMRLHDGLRELQSWRNQRRQRHADGAATEQPPVVAPAAPPTFSSGTPGSMPGIDLEPLGFVSLGGRLVPIFGEIQPTANATNPASPSTAPISEQPAPPPAPPRPPEPRPVPSSLETMKPLTLPPPTPPACLNPTSTSAQPSPAGEATSPCSTSAKFGPTDAEDATASTTAKVEATARPRADAEVLRLEQIHNEHRSLLTALLSEHRQALRQQAEAAAARHEQLVREMCAEHRAELGKVLAAHSEHIRDLLIHHREQVQHTVDIAERVERHASSIAGLSELLARQSEVQVQDHGRTGQHIDGLAAFIGDLTHTVGLLAVATYADKPETALRAPPRQTAPPLVAPAPSPELRVLIAPVGEPAPNPKVATSPRSLHTAVRDCDDDDELIQGIDDSAAPLFPEVPSLVPPRAASI